jgi:hypothetical protein
LFGIDRKTVSKILKHSVPPGYTKSLDSFDFNAIPSLNKSR